LVFAPSRGRGVAGEFQSSGFTEGLASVKEGGSAKFFWVLAGLPQRQAHFQLGLRWIQLVGLADAGEVLPRRR